METLTRPNDHPGELAGYGPVISDLARQVAEAQTRGQWRYTIDDPDTGQPLGNGITRRRPTTAQRRQIEAQNPTCIHPGCRAPAINADIDHRIEYAHGGPPTPTTSTPTAPTTTPSATAPAGPAPPSKTATTSTKAASATNTPPAAGLRKFKLPMAQKTWPMNA
ncbi:MAG: HNH endonuclease signature motif containing protein [Acidimicrobiia bacterium]|nr:HNH endonuclease [Acidimicrobiia bacterium]